MISSNRTTIAALLTLLASPIGFAQSTQDTPSTEDISANKVVDTVTVRIDFENPPEDEGGNLFLVGFDEVGEDNMPVSGSQPNDFQQIGVWVRSWPFEKEVSVTRGLHYMALYGYSEYPSASDVSSNTSQQTESSGGELQFIIYQNVQATDDAAKGPEGTPPADEIIVEKIPLDVQENPTTISVQFDPKPEEEGGKIFLTGFEQFDPILGLPQRGAEPIHFRILDPKFEGTSLSVDVQLQKGLGYIAMYGWGEHPETGDRMGKIIHYEGGETLELTIGSHTVGSVPKGAKVPEGVGGTPGEANAQEASAASEEEGRGLLLPGLLLTALLGLLGGWWIQRSRGETTSQLERVGESEDDS